ncbi:HAUS augmin-like complex subunit 8 [Plecturocebus cupreus]
MEMMESQTLLLTLLAVKMENNLAEFERRAEKNLLIMCKEKEKLQKKAHELKHRLLLSQRKRELADVLDAQGLVPQTPTLPKGQPSIILNPYEDPDSVFAVQMLSPFEAVAKRFREQYKTFATALDTTRHELPVRSIHLEGDGRQLLDALQCELMTTQRLLGELDIGNSEENVQMLDLLSELKDVIVKKDLELRRTFAQVLELSAEVSKEAALANQEVWEEGQGLAPPSQWYFNQDITCGESRGAPKNTPLSEDNTTGASSALTQATFISPREDVSSSSQGEATSSATHSGRDLGILTRESFGTVRDRQASIHSSLQGTKIFIASGSSGKACFQIAGKGTWPTIGAFCVVFVTSHLHLAFIDLVHAKPMEKPAGQQQASTVRCSVTCQANLHAVFWQFVCMSCADYHIRPLYRHKQSDK